MDRKYAFVSAVLICAIGALLIMYLHGASLPVLQPHGPVASGERWIMILTLSLCAIVVIPVFLMLFAFAWMFRADHPRSHRWHMPDWDHYSVIVESVWWFIPTVIIAVLAGVAWESSYEFDPYRAISTTPPIVIQVVALDWKWLFIYPQQGIASVNMVEFPQNVPVRFVLTADAPMNSFWIPSLGGQIMVMPGMTTQLNLLASDTGIFNGLSGNLSGKGFAGMTFTAQSIPQSDFDAWVQNIRDASSPRLDPDSYDALAQASTYDPVAFYSSIDSTVYESVSMKYMMPEHAMMNVMPVNTMPWPVQSANPYSL